MIDITVKGLDDLIKAIENVKTNLSKEIGIAVWRATKRSEKQAVRVVQQELATNQAAIKETITSERHGETGAVLTVHKTRRIPLKDFGAKQNSVGVTYKISKTRGRKTLRGGFQGPSPGVLKASWKGNAFKRVGRARLPIVKLKGPSPWGVFRKRGGTGVVAVHLEQELAKEIAERVRFNKLKAAGGLRGQQP